MRILSSMSNLPRCPFSLSTPFIMKKASPILGKTIASAVANARIAGAEDIRREDSGFYVKEIRVDEGPTMKRIRPRAQGRAYQILKRTSHIQVTVSPVQ